MNGGRGGKLNLLKNITIKNTAAVLSALMVCLVLGVGATGYLVLNEVRGTSDTWERYERITARKADHLSDLRAALGYGGVIHQFKNFILRKNRLLIVDVHARMLDVTVALTSYSALGMTERESKAISVLEGTLTNYLDAVARAESLANSGMNPQQIDGIVRIDDRPALQALDTLSDELRKARQASATSVYRSVSRVTAQLVGAVLVVGGLTALLVSGFFWFSRVQFITPLLELGRIMRELADGDTETQVPYVHDTSELGEMARSIEVFRENVARRRHAEEELRQIQRDLEERVKERTVAAVEAMEEAKRANDAKSEFLSSMSHELRTPLNAMLGFTQLLQSDSDSPLSASQVEATEQVLKSGDHLLNLIDKVLDLAAIESGRVALDVVGQDPTRAIESCSTIAGNLADQNGLAFYDRTSAWSLPEISIDETRFRLVLLNLLSNAVKYNRDGGSVTLSAGAGAGGSLRLSVADTGRGIAEDKQTQLFTPFSRLGLENSNITGTGIGLTITKELVEAMGGTIGFESTLERGSTFWLEFPIVGGTLSVRDHSEKPTAAPGSPAAAVATSAAADLEPRTERTVLCVEDDPSSQKLLESIIKRIPGAAVISAHTGELGLDLAEIHRPDVILMDVNLPGIDGIEALRRLKASPATTNIPVIALTAMASRADRARGMEAGFEEYLTKPISVEQVTAAITGHF